MSDAYYVALGDRPSLCPDKADVPLIDLGGLWKDPARRSAVVKDIAKACCHFGFLQESLMCIYIYIYAPLVSHYDFVPY